MKSKTEDVLNGSEGEGSPLSRSPLSNNEEDKID